MLYPVSGTSNGCTAIKTVTATVLPLPVVNISAKNIICAGESLTLTANGAVNYTWSTGGTAPVEIVIPLVPNSNLTYTVNGSDSTGCSNTSAISVSVSVCEGLSDNLIVKGNMYSVFPNPTKGKLTIISSSETHQVNAQIFDISGKKVAEQVLNFSGNERAAEFNLSGFAAGTYLMKLNSKDGSSENIRVIKE